jgi:amino acid transporter
MSPVLKFLLTAFFVVVVLMWFNFAAMILYMALGGTFKQPHNTYRPHPSMHRLNGGFR